MTYDVHPVHTYANSRKYSFDVSHGQERQNQGSSESWNPGYHEVQCKWSAAFFVVHAVVHDVYYVLEVHNKNH